MGSNGRSSSGFFVVSTTLVTSGTHRRGSMSCAQCEGIDQLFDSKRARRQLLKFRRKGADRTTRMLIEDVQAAMPQRSDGNPASLLLDVGAGVGAIHHTLLDRGVE